MTQLSCLRRRIPAAIIFACMAGLLAATASPLRQSKSAFLLEHADSPVRWMPWGPAAFARAAETKKPVFLAIGASAHELSRAMQRQTFARAEIAAELNERFVCVLVDRDEMPDVAAYFQVFVRAARQLEGWPLNIWLTPTLQPFDGAAYLPPTEEWGQQGFINVLKRVAADCDGDAAVLDARARTAIDTMRTWSRRSAPPAFKESTVRGLLAESREAWQSARVEVDNAGTRGNPEPEMLRVLLRDETARAAALAMMRTMLAGGLRDPLDGGFFKHTIDPTWTHPYFQKTLVDQARLAHALLDAARISGDAGFATAARGGLRYAINRLSLGDGAFAAGEDSVAEDRTLAHLWTHEELRAIVPRSEFAAFCKAYGVTEKGNLGEDAYPGMATAGRNLLAGGATVDDPALEAARAALLKARSARVQPVRDRLATAGEHGLLLGALARAGGELKDAKLRAAADTVYGHIRERLFSAQGGLLRFHDRAISASADDLALVAEGLLAYHAVSAETAARELAFTLLRNARDAYLDPTSARFACAREGAGSWLAFRAALLVPLRDEVPLPSIAIVGGLSRAGLASSGEFAPLFQQLTRAIVDDAMNSPVAIPGDVLLALTFFLDAQ